MRFHKKLSKKQDPNKGKKIKNSSKETDKIISKKKIKIECFNCSRLEHVSSGWPSPKNIKKAI